MKTHELKTLPEFFAAVLSGVKNFEARNDDRGFEVGDELVLREWVSNSFVAVGGHYTGRFCRRTVTYKLAGGHFGIAEGWCVLGLRKNDSAIVTRIRDNDGKVIGYSIPAEGDDA